MDPKWTWRGACEGEGDAVVRSCSWGRRAEEEERWDTGAGVTDDREDDCMMLLWWTGGSDEVVEDKGGSGRSFHLYGQGLDEYAPLRVVTTGVRAIEYYDHITEPQLTRLLRSC